MFRSEPNIITAAVIITIVNCYFEEIINNILYSIFYDIFDVFLRTLLTKECDSLVKPVCAQLSSANFNKDV